VLRLLSVWLGRCGTFHFGKLSQTIIIPVNTNSHNEDSMFGGFYTQADATNVNKPTQMEGKENVLQRSLWLRKNAAMQKSVAADDKLLNQVCQTWGDAVI
jgi:hypothetical protein